MVIRVAGAVRVGRSSVLSGAAGRQAARTTRSGMISGLSRGVFFMPHLYMFINCTHYDVGISSVATERVYPGEACDVGGGRSYGLAVPIAWAEDYLEK